MLWGVVHSPFFHNPPPLLSLPHIFHFPQEAGMVSMSDLALQYALGTELLATAVSRRVGTVIRGRLEGGLLYTPAFIRRWGIRGGKGRDGREGATFHPANLCLPAVSDDVTHPLPHFNQLQYEVKATRGTPWSRRPAVAADTDPPHTSTLQPTAV